tara:strand:- start:413 stop:2299 length:1887 start_codon:yes stop_codon:yes gene_type:complete
MSRRINKRTDEEKREILQDYDSGELTKPEVVEMYGFNSLQHLYTSVSAWRKLFPSEDLEKGESIGRENESNEDSENECISTGSKYSDHMKVQLLAQYTSGISREDLMRNYNIPSNGQFSNLLRDARGVDVTKLSESVYVIGEDGEFIDVTDPEGLIPPIHILRGKVIPDDVISAICRDYVALDWIKYQSDLDERFESESESISAEPRTYTDRFHPDRGDAKEFDLVSDIAETWGVSPGAVDNVLIRGIEKGFITQEELDKIRNLRYRRKTQKFYDSRPKGEDHYAYGKEMPEETRQKISEANKNREVTLGDLLEEVDKTLETEIVRTPHIEKVIDGVVIPDPGAKRRRKDLEIAGKGHQRMVAFLMDPENYKRIFEPGFELLYVDFTLENNRLDKGLFESHKDLVERLEMSDLDEEVINFIDRNAVLDLFFRRVEDGSYAFAEVKQYATNKVKENGKPGDQNEDRTRQQFYKYKGMITSNIWKINKHLPLDQRISDNILGYVAAYKIGADLQSMVQEHGDRIAIIDEEEVTDYLGEPSKVVEERVPNPDSRERHMEREGALDELRASISGSSEQGVYDQNGGVLEFEGRLYEIGNSITARNFIAQAIKEGSLRKGHVNSMKYDERREL